MPYIEGESAVCEVGGRPYKLIDVTEHDWKHLFLLGKCHRCIDGSNCGGGAVVTQRKNHANPNTLCVVECSKLPGRSTRS